MNDTLTSLAQLLGAGTIGAVLLKLVERIFARADTRDQLAVGLRAEMVARLATLERQFAELEQRERETFRKAVLLEAENRQLRERFHRLINWISSEPSLPQPPSWVYERIEGPTGTQPPEPKP